jgi:arylsulfatase A-like enzyme
MKSVKKVNIAIFSLASISALAQTKPNVLYIMTDQQSYNMMSCMGNKWLKTPNMDELASKGYRFEKTYCANPVSMPSRFSLLTGHYASEVGVKENTSAYNNEKVQQIASKYGMGVIFRNAGYETLYSGKTHLYGTKDVSEYGFTINNTDPYDGPAIYAEQILPTIGKEKPFFLFLSFINPHDICYKAGMDKRYPYDLPEANVRETARILAWQKTISSEEYQKQIPPRASNPQPINGEHPDMVSMDIFPRSWNNYQIDLYNWMYHRLTESVDAQIGRVLAALKKSGLEENTIIIFTSDHGDMNGSHGLILKNVMFEEAQRVPFIFVGKGIKANAVDNKSLTCNGIDLIPTLCDLTGVKYNKDLPGISLKPYLTGEGKIPTRKYIVSESYHSFQITDGRYKYTIYELSKNPEILTDLQVNQGETINYATDKSYSKIKKTLKKELMSNLSKRGLTPLAQDRTIENLRKTEKATKGKGKKNNDEE